MFRKSLDKYRSLAVAAQRAIPRRDRKGAVAVLLLAMFVSAGYAADSRLADAVQNRDLTAVQTLLKQHMPVNAPQTDGTTALHWAAHWNDAETVNLLIAAGADAKAVNRYGATPLSEAAALGNAAIVEALLKAGADPNTRSTSDGETILMTTARSGNAQAVRALLNHGADVNAKETYRGQTALMWAAAERHTDVVKLLLEHGADWKVISVSRETRLPKLSAASSVTPFARGGFTAFLFTAREGDIETAKVMLDAGVDINQTDIDGTSALVVGIMNKHYTFAKFLLDRGADPNVTDVKGRAALYAAVDIRSEDWSAMPSRKLDDAYPSIDLIKLIVAHGAKVNTALTKNLPGRSGMDSGDTTLDEGSTPLMRAARSGDAATMRLLLAAGADLNLATKEGNNALMFAAGVGYRDKNTRGSEAEALEALKVCVEQGIDINKTNSKGETALHGAASRGADTIVQYLVAHGAKMDLKTGRGFTPLDIAMGKDSFSLPVPHDSTVALIRSLGGVESPVAR
ncbi:MAG TPA: ankyrin repeat domain-containing protein [Bryobacteraceae bacterium]|nr:ankyrin repeat domain-containing protein [Bryobacteraceae bacterium]